MSFKPLKETPEKCQKIRAFVAERHKLREDCGCGGGCGCGGIFWLWRLFDCSNSFIIMFIDDEGLCRMLSPRRHLQGEMSPLLYGQRMSDMTIIIECSKVANSNVLQMLHVAFLCPSDPMSRIKRSTVGAEKGELLVNFSV